MKKFIILVVALAAYTVSDAQQFVKGTSVLSAGMGLGSSLGGYGSQTPGLSVQYEKGIWEIGGPGVISMGGYIGHKSYKDKGTYYTAKWGYTIIGVRSAYHYNGLKSAEKFDVYGGAMLSYNVLNYKYKGSDGRDYSRGGSYGSGVGFTLYIGGRYFFSENLAAFAELGYGVSFLTLGLAYKF